MLLILSTFKQLCHVLYVFQVQEFWASEEYFFHTEEQMALVSKYCPDIKQMLFMFQQTSCPKVRFVLILSGHILSDCLFLNFNRYFFTALIATIIQIEY